jgi:hypothetical protein
MLNWNNVEEQVREGYISKQRHPMAPLTIYNYTHKCQYDWHWTPETIACRGLIVADDGQIVARPFPKLFSVEQLDGNLPSGPFEVYDKLDGSLGVLYFIGERPWIATRGSFTSEQSEFANHILDSRYHWVRFRTELTYLFEIIHPSNRIVVDYGDMEDLVLLAIIDTATGKDLPLEDIGFPIAKRYDGIQDFAELVALEDPNKEGFVVRFTESGQRVKMKFAEYKRLHRLLTGLSARGIWESMQTPEGLQPIIDRVPDEFYAWVRTVEAQLRTEYAAIEDRCKDDFKDLGDRKTTALYFQTCPHPAILFKMLDGKDYSSLIWKVIYPEPSRPFKDDDE